MVNLCGTIVPIVDLRLMLGRGPATYDASTVVIILSLTDRTVGVVVDSVFDVIELAAEQIKPASELGTAGDARFIRGIASVGERMLIVLDIEHMVRDTSLRGYLSSHADAPPVLRTSRLSGLAAKASTATAKPYCVNTCVQYCARARVGCQT